jgi:hypothetical protein
MNFLPCCVNIGPSIERHYEQTCKRNMPFVPFGSRLYCLYYCIRVLCSALSIAVWKRYIEAQTGGVIILLCGTLQSLCWPSFICHSCVKLWKYHDFFCGDQAWSFASGRRWGYQSYAPAALHRPMKIPGHSPAARIRQVKKKNLTNSSGMSPLRYHKWGYNRATVVIKSKYIVRSPFYYFSFCWSVVPFLKICQHMKLQDPASNADVRPCQGQCRIRVSQLVSIRAVFTQSPY